MKKLPIQFMIMDVMKMFVIGSENPREGMSSSGRISTFRQRIHRGGIHTVCSIFLTVIVVCEMYSTHALQNIARQRLIQGAITQPNRAKDMCDRDGMKREMEKQNSVRRMA